MKLAGVFLVLFLNAMFVQFAYSADRRVSVDEAKKLVMLSLSKEQQQLPGLEAEHENSKSRFWDFTVVWQGLAQGSVVVGVYAVDSLTGDVFSAASSCDERGNKNLKAFQWQVRRWLHLSKSSYLRLKTKGPLCDN